MQLFLHKSLPLFRWFYPDFVWKIPTTEPIIYLTFDDGPIPEITDWVLDQLKMYDAKATFFCIGDNIVKNPEVMQRVVAAGHGVGNHTYNHLNGWKTKDDGFYYDNVKQCQAVMPVKTNLFRPPYGRIKLRQAKPLLPDYKIVMWDVLTGDFERYLSPEYCLRKTLKYTEAGSIVVMHDSQKAWQNMSYVLPRMLAHFTERGFRFEALDSYQ